MKLAISGLGYTGKAILENLPGTLEGNELFSFSRKTVTGNSAICDFRLPPSSWGDYNKNRYDRQLVTFSIHDLPEENITALLAAADRSFLFSSTGVFSRSGGFITEKSPKDKDHKRYQAEKFWLKHGGHIIYLAGIYGPGRNPVDWIIKEKVTNSPRQLNMIHVEDIVRYTTALLTTGQSVPHEMILADGQIHSWEDVYHFAFTNKWTGSYPAGTSSKENAFCDSNLVQTLFPELIPVHFWTGLSKLNSRSVD